MTVLQTTLHGGSMDPLLKSGDEVLVDSSVLPASLRRGDIIATGPSRGALLLHRFLGRTRDGRLITQADNSAFRDEPVMPSEYRGRLMAWRRRTGGRWMRPRPALGRFHAFLARRRPRKLIRLLQWLLLPISRQYVHSRLPEMSSLEQRKEPEMYSNPNDARARSLSRGVSQSGRDLEYQELGLEAAIHDPQSGEVHLLNAVARAIWHWSREGLSPEGMVERLAAFYPTVARDILAGDVKSTLDHLRRLRLIPGAAE